MLARLAVHEQNKKQVAESIRQLQRHGLVDARLDPTITSAVVGSMTNRFPELWLSEGLLDCSFDDGVEHLTIIFMNALQLKDPEQAEILGRNRGAPAHRSRCAVLAVVHEAGRQST